MIRILDIREKILTSSIKNPGKTLVDLLKIRGRNKLHDILELI